jgi:hypothetical protein
VYIDQSLCPLVHSDNLHTSEPRSTQGCGYAADSLILGDGQSRVGGESGVTTSPVNLLKILISSIWLNLLVLRSDGTYAKEVVEI